MLRKFLLWVLLPWLWVVPCLAGSAESIIALHADQQRYPFDGRVAVFRDPGGEITINEVVALDRQGRFSPVRKEGAYGYTRDAVWVRMVFQRGASVSADWRLEATNAVIDDYQLFHVDPAGRATLVLKAGARYPSNARPFEYRHPLFPVFLDDANPQVYYLRVQSASSLNFNLVLWQPAELRSAIQLELMFIGLALGMIFQTLLIALFGSLSTRGRGDFGIVACGLFFAEFLATHLGITAQYVFTASPSVIGLLTKANLCFSSVAVLVLVRQNLPISDFFPRVNRFVWALAAICAGLLATAIAGAAFIAIPVAHVLTVSMILLGLVTAWRCSEQGALAARTFLFVYGLVMLIDGFTILSVSNVVDDFLSTELSISLSILLYCLCAQLALIRDVRQLSVERERAEKEREYSVLLAEQEKRLREEQSVFFSFVAHELRNPLGVILSGMANLRHELFAVSEKVVDRVGRISKTARYMSDLIDRHLRLQRVLRSDFVPEFDACSPNFPAEVARQMVAEKHPGSTINTHFAEDLPAEMAIDSELITFALVNLLDNALKYSPWGSPVGLSVEVQGEKSEWVDFKVIDSGPGIPDAEKESLFRLYQRNKSGHQTGFGIGLTFVHRIAKHHGGDVSCISTPAGCTFCLRLPGAMDLLERAG